MKALPKASSGNEHYRGAELPFEHYLRKKIKTENKRRGEVFEGQLRFCEVRTDIQSSKRRRKYIRNDERLGKTIKRYEANVYLIFRFRAFPYAQELE